MLRILLLLLGVVAFTWLEFRFFPGHSYLQSGTQLYLPMLEHLDTPGYLSRDFVATHPILSYTIYDEVTLFLHEAVHLNLQSALVGQQILCRAAGICGVFLLAASSGLSDVFAFLIGVLVNLGATLVGPAVCLVDREPVPAAFAIGLMLLAAGLLARERPLLAGLMGGLAFIYEPVLASPFWLVVLVALIFDSKMRRLLRPTLTILVVFALLLANIGQLQPGAVEAEGVWARLLPSVAELQKFRIPQVWVSLWAPMQIWNYLAVWVCGVWATVRIWPTLNRPLRWFLVALPLCGLFSVAISNLLVEQRRLLLGAEMHTSRELVFTIAFASIACGVAGAQSLVARRTGEACLWFVVVVALPIQAGILNLLQWNAFRNVLQLAVALALSAALVWLGIRFRAAILLMPVAAVFLMPVVVARNHGHIDQPSQIRSEAVRELGIWAQQSTATWGSSIFLFPDAGRETYPGAFRALSQRALWVDWKSGDLICCFNSVALTWSDRWQQTMQGKYSPLRLQGMLTLPIDYYVLKAANRLANVRPVFVNSEFVVYDAQDLRNAPTPLY